jgi:hypothetical protein
VLDLVLRSKIVSNKLNKCVEISIVYKGISDEPQIQTWKFDMRKKSDIHYWFASEAEEVKFQ